MTKKMTRWELHISHYARETRAEIVTDNLDLVIARVRGELEGMGKSGNIRVYKRAMVEVDV
jgi:beta-mannanase